jgi:hypothetical protein
MPGEFKLGGVTLFSHTGVEGSGSINVQNTVLDATTATFPAGHIVQVKSTNLSDTNNQNFDSAPPQISETTSYNNTALLPLLETNITPIHPTSHFYITLSGRFGINTGYRSQILLSKNWGGAGTNAYNDGKYIWSTHYGLYNNTGGDLWYPGQYAYMDKHQDHTVGVQRTYSWFGGSIGSGTQTYTALNMTVLEIRV